MNWIIKDTNKLKCHTYLNDLLNPTWIDISEFNWVMSDLDVYNYSKEKLPIDFRENYSIFNPENFKRIVDSDLQIIWGLISVVKKSEIPKVDKENFPYVDGNIDVWKNDIFLVENSASK